MMSTYYLVAVGGLRGLNNVKEIDSLTKLTHPALSFPVFLTDNLSKLSHSKFDQVKPPVPGDLEQQRTNK